MTITIRLFAGIAEALQTRSFTVDVVENATLKEVQDQLISAFPQAESLLKQCFFSVNQEFATLGHKVTASDEIALIPPVSGGEEELFLITEEPLSADPLIKKVSHPNAGAILAFVGTVRELTLGKRTIHLEYEAYPEMAVKKMKQIAAEIEEQWPGTRVAMSHRVGRLDIEDIAVVIAVATPHRAASFESGRYAIERLKEIVPIWKKEQWEDGEEWVGHQQGPWKPMEYPTE